MKTRSRTIPLVLSLCLAAVLLLGSAVPQPTARAMDILVVQDPGISPLDDSPPPLPTDGVEKTDRSSGIELPFQHSEPISNESPAINSDTFTIEPHHVVLPFDARVQRSSIQVPAAPDGWTTIMTEGFEGAFPGTDWAVFQRGGTTNGEYYWDDDSYRPHTGSWSAWPANGGADAIIPPANYANNMDSWMVYGPFDLSDAVDAELLFSYWLSSEQDFDYFGWYVSIDSVYYLGSRTSGNSGGWVAHNFDLTFNLGDLSDKTSVWIAFIFSSDSSVTGEGVYVDDVIVRKNIGERNLTPFALPGWEQPLVPSSVTGTETVGTLYTYQNTYIDWAVINSGTAVASGTFSSCLSFDFAWIECWDTVDLGVGTRAYVPDWILNLTPTPGWHNLGVVVDVNDDIAESNETDNSWSKDFYWHPNANLTPYKQGSWDHPLVPASVTGTNSVNDLYTSQNTYIDWTIKNWGPDAILAQFDTCLYLDDVEVNCWYTNGKIAGNIAFVEDWVLNLTPSPGWHNLKIVTDVNDDIAESDETDNTWANDFYWNPPPNPDIDISPASLTSQQAPDQVKTLQLEIHNYGNASLDWSIVESPTESCSPADIPWVSVAPDSGTSAPGAITPIDVVLDSTGLAVGIYQGVLCVNSNDPDESLITIPITLETIEELTIFLPMLFRP